MAPGAGTKAWSAPLAAGARAKRLRVLQSRQPMNAWASAVGLVCLAGAPLGCSCEQPRPQAAGAAGAPGYVLFAPLLSTTTYLIDKSGRVLYVWQGEFPPGASVHLLENGHLLHRGRQPGAPFSGRRGRPPT